MFHLPCLAPWLDSNCAFVVGAWLGRTLSTFKGSKLVLLLGSNDPLAGMLVGEGVVMTIGHMLVVNLYVSPALLGTLTRLTLGFVVGAWLGQTLSTSFL